MECKSHLDSSWRLYMAILALPLWHADFMYFSKISRTPPNLKTSKSGRYLGTFGALLLATEDYQKQ